MKKFRKNALELTKTSLVFGVGSDVVQKVGGNPSGLNAAASYLPSVGGLIGANAVLDMLPKQRKRRK